MALSGIQIYKLLPQTNCKECGFPTCLAFSMKLAAKQVELDLCPYVEDEAREQLAESAAPPIRMIELSANGHAVKAGNEVVLFRHEKTFYNRPGLFVCVCDDMAAAALTEKVKAVDAYQVDYVGIDLALDGIAVKAASGDAGAFSAAVSAIREATSLPLILIADDPAVIGAGLQAVDGEKPLIVGANADNWEAMADLAVQHETALGVSGGTLDELADLTEKIKGKGVENMVLYPAVDDLSQSLILNTQIRRLALKNVRELGYPTIAFPGNADDPGREAILAGQAIAKYAGFVVVDTFTPELAYSLLVLRQNIYTDPQKPIQVQPDLYEINNPKPTDPLLVTTNFSITYFSVANEVEGAGLPRGCWSPMRKA